MFETADALLFEARLSPVFWCDAVSYSQHCYNRMPNRHTGPSTPHQMLTGARARWDKLRLFGCDAYHLIPNDPLAKVPGVVKGKKTIFVGFTDGCNAQGYGFWCFSAQLYSTMFSLIESSYEGIADIRDRGSKVQQQIDREFP